MMEKKATLAAFWRGYATALDICPFNRPRAARFVFRGYDLSKISTSDALNQDWRMVGASITSALQQMNERENERRHIEQQCSTR